MRADQVVLLTCEGDVGRIAARYLAARFVDLQGIVEKAVPRLVLLRRRLKHLGLTQVGGQLAFMAFQRLQRGASQRRIAEIVGEASLPARWPDASEIIRVSSINSPECLRHLQRLRP